MRFDGPVLLVSDTTEFAGAELYAVVLVEALREECDFVAVLGEGAAEETRRRLAHVGAEVRTVRGLRRRPPPPAIRELARTIKEVDPALLHVNLTDQGDGLAPLLSAGWSDAPSVATLHLVLPNRARWREALSRKLLRRIDTTIAVSDAVGGYLAEAGIGRTVVKNGLPAPEPVADPRAALGLGEEAFVVGGIGRLHEQKGWDVLCEAAPIVERARPGTAFVVIGDGPDRERLEAYADAGSPVRFVGRRSQAASLIPAFDLLVAPSRFEGLGLVAVESMYLGVPVVATDIAGLGEVLGDCAVLVPPDDPEQLAQGILRLAGDPDLQADLARRGKARVEALFSVSRMAEETLHVYESVGPRRAGAGATVSA